MATINFEQFEAVEMRVGCILRAERNEKARKPAYKLWIDFGEEIGLKQSSAQIVDLYAPEELAGRLVVAVTNFPPKMVAGWVSEVLVLGVPDDEGRVCLLSVDDSPPLGARVF
ncbi:tRNA-binding protein [Acetomicrobium sp. S15 = DSM 107314]|jgi:tRNA-binding protein|uniref:tRNA-binding protein n=1 Tax=Acetomicrobium sp. S15 = DSM 107314 TaxID=2529858 RepID=UPI0018E0FEB9|nr:tRNA-binding protein [Acetomicrobium sp. S15 = DSM 107314]